MICLPPLLTSNEVTSARSLRQEARRLRGSLPKSYDTLMRPGDREGADAHRLVAGRSRPKYFCDRTKDSSITEIIWELTMRPCGLRG